MKKYFLPTILFFAISCQKRTELPPASEKKETKPVIDFTTAPKSAPLSDSSYIDDLPKQQGTPIVINGRLFIKH